MGVQLNTKQSNPHRIVFSPVNIINTVVKSMNTSRSNPIQILSGLCYNHYSELEYTPVAKPARLGHPAFTQISRDGATFTFLSSFGCVVGLSWAPSNFQLQLILTRVFAFCPKDNLPALAQRYHFGQIYIFFHIYCTCSEHSGYVRYISLLILQGCLIFYYHSWLCFQCTGFSKQA